MYLTPTVGNFWGKNLYNGIILPVYYIIAWYCSYSKSTVHMQKMEISYVCPIMAYNGIILPVYYIIAWYCSYSKSTVHVQKNKLCLPYYGIQNFGVFTEKSPKACDFRNLLLENAASNVDV